MNTPVAVVTWPWTAIKRTLTMPKSTREYLSPGLLRSVGGELGYEPTPDKDDLEMLESYAARVERFAKDFLANPSWGPRAVHDASRNRSAVRLPRARPEKLIRVGSKRTGGAATFTELEKIVKANRPRRELRGSRRATWQGALKAVSARLASEPVSTVNRRHLSNARRYLEAAVDHELSKVGGAVDPVEPTDHPLWEQKVDQRIRARTNQSPDPPGPSPSEADPTRLDK